MTAWILSFGPSVRYDRAQQASESTSRSVWWTSSARAGRHRQTASNGGGGFLLRQRFDSVHVTLRRNDTGVSALMWRSSGSRQPELSTWSRRSGPSPATNTTDSPHPSIVVTQERPLRARPRLWHSALKTESRSRDWDLGILTRVLSKLLPYNLYCDGGDIKHYSTIEIATLHKLHPSTEASLYNTTR